MLPPLKRSSVFLVALGFIVLVGVEVFFRISGVAPRASERDIFTQYDPLYGWKKPANLRKIFNSDEYAVLEEFNSHGLRGPEYTYQKPTGEYRILILGDSHTESSSVEFQNSFCEVLKTNLNRRKDRPYQVINAGTRGYSTDQQLLFFQHEGRRYHPDLTLVMVSASNVWQNTQAQTGWPKPFFRIRNGQLVLANRPVPQLNLHRGFEKIVLRHCSLCRWTYEQFRRGPFLSWMLQFKLAPIPEYFDLWKKTEDSRSRYAWELTAALLTELKKEAEDAGSKFLVVYIPMEAQVDDHSWMEMRKKYALRGDGWDRFKVPERLEELCQKNKIDYLNLGPQFIGAMKKNSYTIQDLYFLSDRHWTIQGHKLAGMFLNDTIEQKYLGSQT